jgi:hypothetical protein
MTVNDPQSEIELDFEPAKRVLCRANAFVLANLPPIVDVSRLREGDADEDYFVDVPARCLHDIGDLITPLEYIALMRFDVGVGVMPIARKDTRTAL